MHSCGNEYKLDKRRIVWRIVFGRCVMYRGSQRLNRNRSTHSPTISITLLTPLTLTVLLITTAHGPHRKHRYCVAVHGPLFTCLSYCSCLAAGLDATLCTYIVERVLLLNIKLVGRKVYFFVWEEGPLEGLAVNFSQLLKQFVSCRIHVFHHLMRTKEYKTEILTGTSTCRLPGTVLHCDALCYLIYNPIF
jgi:hypothetical protein